MNFFNTVLDILFPSSCFVCGKKGSELCLECINDAQGSERECARWIYPVYEYRYPPIKKAIHLLKYKNKKGLATLFAQLLYPKILEELSELSLMENFNSPILISIPLSQQRYRERGYNQSELICRELIKLDNNTNFELKEKVLIKIKDTKHQAHIKNRNERLQNLHGSFKINKEALDKDIIKKRNIILIDDIITTGATFAEAKKTLKKGGANKIIAFAIAH